MDAVAQLDQYLRHQRLILDYAYVAAVAVFVYDYLLTLHLEIELIWFSRWTYTKVLFLLVRYTAFTSVFLTVYVQLFPDIPLENCQVFYPVVGWLLACSIIFAELIIAIRTWAVWRQHRIIGFGLMFLALVSVALRFPFINRFIKSIGYGPIPYSGFRGCFFTRASRQLWINYALSMALEAIVLVLMVISAYRSSRRGDNGKLSHSIHRDGIAFYAYILTLSSLNLAFAIALPLDLMAMLNPLQEFLFSVLTARIVLTIRNIGYRRGLPLELHTGYETPTPSFSLRLMSDGQQAQEQDRR